jgi:threonine dehydrogenase-like Zn-dependent dehydrogenase
MERNAAVKTLVLENIGELRMKDLPRPQVEAGMVELRVSHCAVCRTDLKMWRQGHRDLVMPRILGHEVAGTLENTGDRYVVWPGECCGKCDHCTANAENLCASMRILGFHRDGGCAEYVAVPKSVLVAIPPSLPGFVACLAEPLACGLNALDLAGLGPGQSILILGAGPVGLLMAMAAHDLGARVLLHDINPMKLALSAQFRRKLALEPVALHQVSRVDVAVNACPAMDAVLCGVTSLASGGCYCLFSGVTNGGSFPVDLLNQIHYRQLRVVGAYGCTRGQMARAVQLLRKYCTEVELLVDRRIPIEQAARELPAMMNREVLKYVVEF